MSDDRLTATTCDGVDLWKGLSMSLRRVPRYGMFPPLPYNRMRLAHPPDTVWGVTGDAPGPGS